MKVNVKRLVIAILVAAALGYAADLVLSAPITTSVHTDYPLHPPAIAGGAKFEWGPNPDEAGRNQRWTAILRRNFPDGTSTETLFAVLQQQGFYINRANSMASYDWGDGVCVFGLMVHWTEAGDALTSIDGGSNLGCL